ncbi:MAG: glucosamine-6-phosphate deaminase [Gemmatimonadota bacterium]
MMSPAPGMHQVPGAAAKDEARDPLSTNRGPSFSVAGDAHARERIRTTVVDAHEDIARLVAERIAVLVRERASRRRACVLGLATGSTPIGVYRELIRMHRDEGLSFVHVVTFNLDEYYPMPPESVHSYHRFMWENFFAHIDIEPANVHIPRGDLPREGIEEHVHAYEAAILAAGGIDFQILGIGKTGHIGFNEPGSGAESRTRLVTLDMVTRRDASADFFGEDNVPREALTMGVATILGAREIAILATGEHKSAIVRRAVEGDIAVDVAATFLQRHPATTFFVDRAAAADLTRIATPWMLDEVTWHEALIIRAVTWLSLKTSKAILKLTVRDYGEHHLSSLVAKFGSAGEVNGHVFNALGAKIKGRSKLPEERRIICFSPHPDDDVISMGGILRKLFLNGNEITVAYMTSGNIAVFDHDVRRYVEFLVRLAHDRRLDAAAIGALRDRVYGFLAAKHPGDVDSAEIQDIKRIIRESEAISGIETLGLTSDDAHFLNLPFYQTGKVRKDSIGPADVAIVRAILEQKRPEIIFIAGDLSDPHGTHRMCKEAIEGALDELREEGRVELPDVWLYRGAWQEWSITEATWLIPISQDELRLKIQAIFKHQSQKDSAPFPGQDDREFWQRVEARNKDTAALLDRLGLAEYFAMEAYVVV